MTHKTTHALARAIWTTYADGQTGEAWQARPDCVLGDAIVQALWAINHADKPYADALMAEWGDAAELASAGHTFLATFQDFLSEEFEDDDEGEGEGEGEDE